MGFFDECLGQRIEFDVSGDGKHSGSLVDVGTDIIVVYKESKFYYFPLNHVRHLTHQPNAEGDSSVPELTFTEKISYQTILQNAKGFFCEICLSGHQKMDGYMADVKTDYFVFVTPLGKTILIPQFHLKWISPFANNAMPYSLSLGQVALQPQQTSFAPTFAEQLKQEEGRIITLDEGLIDSMTGLLQKFEDRILEIVDVDEKKHYFHVQHVKNVCVR